MPDPIKPTQADVDVILHQMATFQDGNAQPHTIALINEMADLLQAFALHAQQAREQERAKIAEYLEADDGRHLTRTLARWIRRGEHLKDQPPC